MNKTGFYIVEYKHKKTTWSLNIWADSKKDAKKKLKRIKNGKILEKLKSVKDGVMALSNNDRPALKTFKVDV